ncbi:hypothetical protein GUITHDRAFT_143494 [Guillardia theta CCMP2712]|uniref:Uncharacterized protein n=1 Tax=Guillardia theta (strain CCMP2712) TaxID=905079 RepID=L1ITB6_GUITC|nr:hypothetical protein GUITHDRAFT_143494 [Guillardia theta CCMP2712]EKX39511.1 hypothetical protein GUITHDRAFT_143494 [Guillardia theta CCMP2712]|eukprot:XP_005826491.1 hypothetical protein GUITHDRAFT_143494 [Guillardia theta CCMP2712]
MVAPAFRPRPPDLLLLLLLLCCVVPSCNSSNNLSDDKLAMLLRRLQEERRYELAEMSDKFESTQNRFLQDVKNSKALLLRMEQAAGLGNRLVALVSGYVWSFLSDRALVVEWVSYDQPIVHRSKEVSTMIDLGHFLSLPVKIELNQLMREFAWDFKSWKHLRDDDVAAIQFHSRHGLQSLKDDRRSHFSFYLRNFAGYKIIGVHLRTVKYMTEQEQHTALRCAEFLSHGDASKIFVASDAQSGIELARRVLGKEVLVLESVEPGRQGKVDALVATSRSSYAILASGMGGGLASGRPFYDVYDNTCIKVICPFPVIQRDHPLAAIQRDYNKTCLSPHLRLKFNRE